MFRKIKIFNDDREQIHNRLEVKGVATIIFGFDMETDYSKIQEIYNKIREEINQYVDLQIDTTEENVSICKKEDLNFTPTAISLLN